MGFYQKYLIGYKVQDLYEAFSLTLSTVLQTLKLIAYFSQ